MHRVKHVSAIALFFLMSLWAYGQTGKLSGFVRDAQTGAPVPFANVLLLPTEQGTTTNTSGEFSFSELQQGEYSIAISFIGYEKVLQTEIRVRNNRPTELNIALTSSIETLTAVEVTQKVQKRIESPIALKTISATEIFRNPGSNRDVSKVIQSLPGVSSSLSFRNDIIVRGGAPNENRFFLDGIEIPNINHFATQGSSGGPVGMINVNFIREVEFYAGAFPASLGGGMSALLDIKQQQGNSEKLAGSIIAGSSDFGLMLDGPLGKKTTGLFSIRRSYLQYLFATLALPFLPTYNDTQFKINHRIDEKNTLMFMGLGAFDQFKLNAAVNDAQTDAEVIKRNNYILGYLPVNTQWNYTLGGKWTHFGSGSFFNLIVSRSHLNNTSKKYRGNIDTPDNLLLDYQSQELEHNLRWEWNKKINQWKLKTGAGLSQVHYTNRTFNRINGAELPVQAISYSSTLGFRKYSVFAQLSRKYLDGRLSASLGVRNDFADYASGTLQIFNQFQPRLSLAYALAEQWNLLGSVGRYSQLPPYTVLGFRDNAGTLVNATPANTRYIFCQHLNLGVEFIPTDFSTISLEGFRKNYSNYPILQGTGVSLANLGADFGVIGNAPVEASGTGRTYGVELLVQQRLSTSVYGIVSYTYVRSFFSNVQGETVSSWDNGHVLNVTAGKKFKKYWEVGVKCRYLGGGPYTPYHLDQSALRSVWDNNQQGVYDWNSINSLRNPGAFGLDIRIDKTWTISNGSTLNMYLDVQNVLGSTVTLAPYLTVQRNADGSPKINPEASDQYLLEEIPNESGTRLPSIGILFEF